MDFYQIKERETREKGVIEIYADFQVYADAFGSYSKDLMIRGGKFYAAWDENKGLWTTSELDAARLIDRDIRAYEPQGQAIEFRRRFLKNFGSNSWQQFRLFCSSLPDTPHDLDQKIIFANTEVVKEDYATHKLPYALAEGDISAYEEVVSTLYSPAERDKFEWAMGAIITGDAKKLQKAMVFFGKPGEGKSTILDLFEDVFQGYTLTFEVSAIVGRNAQFGLAPFKDNKLVAIDQDGDLSKVEDNTRLNKLIAHDMIRVNEKHKSEIDIRPACMSLIATNKPVRITDAKSGLIRRIIDVRPTGVLLSEVKYRKLVAQMRFELGAIAYHVLERYKKLGRDYYSGYVPTDMMAQTNVFFNYIESHWELFETNNGATLAQAWTLWKAWLEDTNTKWEMSQFKFREELKDYFDNFEERPWVDGVRVRNWYSGFNASRFKEPIPDDENKPTAEIFSLVLEETVSLFDQLFKSAPAQYSRENEQGNTQPDLYWDDSKRINKDGKEFFPRPDQVVSTCLKDIDTSVEHYVKVPVNHIVIDFDIRDAFGQKSPEKNLAAASSWPPTYAEYSKSGGGVHLHYDYVGSAEDLVRVHSPGIEIKVFTGNTSLRRRLTKCNNVPVAQISSGLRVKEKTVIDTNVVANEQHLRNRIAKALRKEVHDNTKSNMDYIHHVLLEAFNSDIEYDVTDMRGKVMQFALKSTNQRDVCLKMMQTMQFKSAEETKDPTERPNIPNEERPVIFDVEVFPNLFIVCWKYSGSDQVVTMVNPSAREVEALLSLKLIGYNNRGYDNHIMYGAMLGFTVPEIYKLSQGLISNNPNARFREAYNLSFTDIFDFASKKQTLKKWEIELGIKHLELGLPWDEPVPEELWPKVIEYCQNDVHATDVVFQHLKADYIAREILAAITGLSMNSTTQQHAARLVFGENRKPQSKFNYEDLSNRFPGYKFEYSPEKKGMLSTYRGEEVGEGGLVRAKPGMWEDVYLFDIESMHPTSIEILNMFGDEYTKNFSAIKTMRVAIKEGRLDDARQMFGGKLASFLSNEEVAEDLSYALKIVINIVYGLTAAGFDNAFRDPRNVDNIVAKIGALFMVDLMHEIEARGFPVVHVKTDSIKVPSPSPELIDFIMEYGRAFGYKFVHEATYSKMCLVNDAVYVAQVGWAAKKYKIGTWETVGAQFAHPYVKKTLFTKQAVEFSDFCEARSVKTSMWLDFEGEDVPMVLTKDSKQFVGKTGEFVPILPGAGGGVLLREKDGAYSAVTNTTGFRWLEAETVKELHKEDDIDVSYFERLVDKAIANIEKFGSFAEFASHNVIELPKRETASEEQLAA